MKKLIMIGILLVSACAYQPVNHVQIVNDGKLQYSGKGSAAAMMMVAAMGPSGIAIGFAIDAGIAKEIETTANDAGVFINDILQHELAHRKDFLVTIQQPVTVKRFGFLALPGDNDRAMAQFHLEYTDASGQKIVIKFPEDFSKNNSKTYPENILHEGLDDIKKDAEKIRRLWSQAVALTIAKAHPHTHKH